MTPSLSIQSLITTCQILWLIKNRNLFLTVLEAGSPRSGLEWQCGQVLVKSIFPFPEGHLHAARSHGGSSQPVLWPPLPRALIPFMRASPSWPNYRPKSPLPHAITLRIRFQYMNWGGGNTHSFSPWHPHYSALLGRQIGITHDPGLHPHAEQEWLTSHCTLPLRCWM